MFIIATEPNLSILIFVLTQVLSLRIADKIRLHFAEVIGNVHAATLDPWSTFSRKS